ncbi:hypothetical protein [Thermosinus carboxydivorans]|uniref:hypothetical protein n=1 Tax=Thermosinus carboxydivorans TaxID=261685 RepID=UPI0005953980|nr:hypothetical protein [Thermosinus carboxydivorans]
MTKDRLAWYRDQMERAEDGRTLASLMSLMEREFKIPAMRCRKFERRNPGVMALYLEMARRRWEIG